MTAPDPARHACRTFPRAIALAACCAAVLLGGCTGIPDGVQPIDDFELDRYLGRWYEIARLDHRFERGLSNVTAKYEVRDAGGLRVINRGYDDEAGTWQEATGKAFLLEEPHVGRLKVSFFGPFYGAYNIIALDAEYENALVAGPTRDYLWLLSRTPDPGKEARQRMLEQARKLAFPIDELIWVEHTAQN